MAAKSKHNAELYWWSTRQNINRISHPEVLCKNDVLRNFAKFTGKYLCQSLFFKMLQASNFINKETLAQVFPSEFYKISNSTFSYRAPLVAASERIRSYSELKHDTHRSCSKSPSCYFDLQAIEFIIVSLSFFPIPLSWNTIYCPPLSQSDSKYYS